MADSLPPKILFSDYFDLDKKTLDDYGAYDISLVADLPLFIDPFLLFNSQKQEYQTLHENIIRYLRFLRDKSVGQEITPGLLSNWYSFKEVRQNWFGFSAQGNKGSALGRDFARALNENFGRIFDNYGDEQITKGSHLEKLCLIKEGVGRDNISDFTTNLIKDYLLDYTQTFAKNSLNPSYCRNFRVPRAQFNYETESWEMGDYYLPQYKGDFVILTPKNLLTKDDTWINREDLVEDFYSIPNAIPDEELRAQINNYFKSVLPKNPKKKDESEAALKTISQYPVLIDYFIKYKEENGSQAEKISATKVSHTEDLYLEQFKNLSLLLNDKSHFYQTPKNSYTECLKRAHYLKDVIENNDGYRLFYDKHTRKPIEREDDLKICYRLTWYASEFDFNTEVNNGRGPADSKVSMGSADATIVEYKLASNTQLERNLQKQVDIYKKASKADKSIKAIIYFSFREFKRVKEILKRLGLENEESIILVDARKDNKPSASKA